MSSSQNILVVLHKGTDDHLTNDSSNSHAFYKVFKKTVHSPEQALLLAVLQDAIKNKHTKWIKARGDLKNGFSFEFVCEHLGFDSEYMRKGILVTLLDPRPVKMVIQSYKPAKHSENEVLYPHDPNNSKAVSNSSL